MKFSKKFTLVVIGNVEYPFPNASSNRVHAYAKGLTEMDKQVLVICSNPPFKDTFDHPKNGTFEGVEYFYPLGLVKNRNPILRKFLTLISPFYVIFNLTKIRKLSKKIAILEYSTTFYQEIIYWIYCSLFKIPVIREASEIPAWTILSKNIILKWILFIHRNFRIRLYDGIIVISTHIEEYYLRIKKKSTKILKIPILVDLNRFKKVEKTKIEPRPFPYIAYVGNMIEEKDGLEDLIKAFNLFVKSFPNYKLLLIGPVTQIKMEKITTLINSLNLHDKIEITDQMGRNEVIKLIGSASALTLARPRTRRTDAGFPTKLGEYLASGQPVIVTRVGEINLYLKDNYNAYLVEPGNFTAFASKLKFAVSNINESRLIGERGRKLAETVFNYRNYSKQLINFISSLQLK